MQVHPEPWWVVYLPSSEDFADEYHMEVRIVRVYRVSSALRTGYSCCWIWGYWCWWMTRYALILFFVGIDPWHSAYRDRSAWVPRPPMADSPCPTHITTAISPSGTPFLSTFVKGCTYPLRTNLHSRMPSPASALMRLPRMLREDLGRGKSTDWREAGESILLWGTSWLWIFAGGGLGSVSITVLLARANWGAVDRSLVGTHRIL